MIANGGFDELRSEEAYQEWRSSVWREEEMRELSLPPLLVVHAYGIIFRPLIRPFSVSGLECGEYMRNTVYHTVTQPGPWIIGSNSEDIGKSRYFGDENQRRKLWEHTVEVMNGSLNLSSLDGAEQGK